MVDGWAICGMTPCRVYEITIGPSIKELALGILKLRGVDIMLRGEKHARHKNLLNDAFLCLDLFSNFLVISSTLQ